MKSARIVALGAGLLAGVMLAVALQRMSAADQPSPAVEWADPCEGQTDAECNQTIDRLRSEGNQRYINWVKDFVASGQDPRSLPRYASIGTALPPEPDLESAIEGADSIVLGTIAGVTFEIVPPDDALGHAFVQTTARVAVEDTLKGDSDKEIAIAEDGGPEPNTDGTTGHLLYSEATPYLLKGDRALLFLRKDELGYYVQGWTGTYLVDKEDRLDAVTGNPFEASVEAKTLSEFSAQIEALVAVQAGAAR